MNFHGLSFHTHENVLFILYDLYLVLSIIGLGEIYYNILDASNDIIS